MEFENVSGTDHDGVTEYEEYTSYDWSNDLAQSIEERDDDGKYPLHWLKLNQSVGDYERIYLLEFTTDEVRLFFASWEIVLSKEKRSYGYRYSRGYRDEKDTISLVAPDEKREEIEAAEKYGKEHYG